MATGSCEFILVTSGLLLRGQESLSSHAEVNFT